MGKHCSLHSNINKQNERGYLSCLAACVAVALISPPEGGASIPTLLYFYYSIQTSAAEAANQFIIIIIPALRPAPYPRILISDNIDRPIDTKT